MGAIALIEPGRIAAFNKASEQVEALRENSRYSPVNESDLIRVKTPSGGQQAWEISGPSGPEYVRELSGVVVYSGRRRILWGSKAIGSGERPVCSSDDCVNGEIREDGVPDELLEAGMPGGKDGKCSGCPFNEWGSAVHDDGRQGKGKRCQEREIVFFLPENSILPLKMEVSTGSLSVWDKFRKQLSQVPATLRNSFIRLTLKKEESSTGVGYSQIVPEFVGKLSPDAVKGLDEYRSIFGDLFDKSQVDR
jgi:hypothetical protein